MDHVKPVGMVSAGKPGIFSKVFEKPAQKYAGPLWTEAAVY
jgi:hypothetical protein